MSGGVITRNEAIKEGCNGPFIRWDNYGYEGWKPHSYETIREALEDYNFGHEFVITKVAQYEIVDRTGE